MTTHFVRFAYTTTVAQTVKSVSKLLPDAEVVNKGKSFTVDGVGINRTEIILKDDSRPGFKVMSQRLFAKTQTIIDQANDGLTGTCVDDVFIVDDAPWSHDVFADWQPIKELDLYSDFDIVFSTVPSAQMWCYYLGSIDVMHVIAALSGFKLKIKQADLVFGHDAYNGIGRGTLCLVNEKGKVMAIEGISKGFVAIVRTHDGATITFHDALTDAAKALARAATRNRAYIDPDQIRSYFYPDVEPLPELINAR